MQLRKWINNKVDRLWKQIFNDNMDELSRNKIETDNRIEATNNRINNLVLNSGGNSPNEMVDGRTGQDGTIYSTIKGRLDSEFGTLLTKIQNEELDITEINEKLDNINIQLDKLYGEIGGVLSVYVSKSAGNDITGDGTQSNPYRTIQRAVDSIPLILTAQVIIEIESGSYLEDVKVAGVKAFGFHIRSANFNVVSAQNGDTDVFVRSISFEECPCYCLTQGITYVDTANAPVGLSDISCSVKFHRVSYGAVSNCRFNENTRDKNFSAIQYASCIGRTYGSYISNQKYAFFANFLSTVELSSDNVGSNNSTVIRSGRSVVFAPDLKVTGDTVISTWSAGQVFQ